MKALQRRVKSWMILLVVLVIVFAYFFLGFGSRIYEYKCKECDPVQLLPILEWVFDANFPPNIRELKTAKTGSLDGAVLYIVKFSADTNSVEKFLESFPAKSDPEPYQCGRSAKGSQSLFTPRWFKKPIKQGNYLNVSSIRGRVGTSGYLYIDTANRKNTVVYFHGHYPTSTEKREQ